MQTTCAHVSTRAYNRLCQELGHDPAPLPCVYFLVLAAAVVVAVSSVLAAFACFFLHPAMYIMSMLKAASLSLLIVSNVGSPITCKVKALCE